jgi:hypothetical protein
MYNKFVGKKIYMSIYLLSCLFPLVYQTMHFMYINLPFQMCSKHPSHFISQNFITLKKTVECTNYDPHYAALHVPVTSPYFYQL